MLNKKFNRNELNLVVKMIESRINSPECVSAGRLFDAVSSLIGITDYSNFEGQAAMKLEFAIDVETNEHYEFDIIKEEKIIIDWEKLFFV